MDRRHLLRSSPRLFLTGLTMWRHAMRQPPSAHNAAQNCQSSPAVELTITHNFCELRERPKGQVVDKVDNKKGVADDTL